MHKVSDPVYSNSFGLGYISNIEYVKNYYGVSFDRYYVRWMSEEISPYADNRWYEAKGIDTLKMFLRMKLRGENI